MFNPAKKYQVAFLVKYDTIRNFECDTMDEVLKIIRDNFRKPCWCVQIYNMETLQEEKKKSKKQETITRAKA